MKCLKVCGLAVVVAVSLILLEASSASATALYSGSTKLGSGSTIDFSNPSGGSITMGETGSGMIFTCTTSTLKGKLESAATETVEALTFETCTFPVTVTALGKLDFSSSSGTSGTVTADAEIAMTVKTILFGSCIYGFTSGTKIGSLSGNPATFTANAVAEKFSGSNFACPSTAKWTATYNSTAPSNFHIEES